jgi:4-amino-4-deoxy-L-arabinose transferase-like glycosyltransferase
MKQIRKAATDYIGNTPKIILWIFVIPVIIIFILHASLAATYAYPLDYGEAPLVNQARRLSAGENIYSPDLTAPPYNITNYPPLYILLLSPFAESAPFQMGRLISVIAAVGTAVLLARIIYTLSQNRLAALATGASFLAIPYVVHWSGLARVDFLALLLAVAALYVLVHWPNGRWTIIVAALLLIAAIYTRQSYGLAAPLAAFAWLWTQNRRQAITLAVLVAGIGLALFALISLLTNGGFYFHLVTANANEFRWDILVDRLGQLLGDMPIALLLAIAASVAWRQRLVGRPLLVGFFVGAFLSMLTIGKVGSNVNYFLELAAALSLMMGGIIGLRCDDEHGCRPTTGPAAC